MSFRNSTVECWPHPLFACILLNFPFFSFVSLQITYPNIFVQSPTMQENQSSSVASLLSPMISPCFWFLPIMVTKLSFFIKYWSTLCISYVVNAMFPQVLVYELDEPPWSSLSWSQSYAEPPNCSLKSGATMPFTSLCICHSFYLATATSKVVFGLSNHILDECGHVVAVEVVARSSMVGMHK